MRLQFLKFVFVMRSAIIKYKAEMIGAVAGAVAGWSYWYFVGCSSGSCAITSNPFNSTLYGALMGGLAGNMFSKTTNKK